LETWIIRTKAERCLSEKSWPRAFQQKKSPPEFGGPKENGVEDNRNAASG